MITSATLQIPANSVLPGRASRESLTFSECQNLVNGVDRPKTCLPFLPDETERFINPLDTAIGGGSLTFSSRPDLELFSQWDNNLLESGFFVAMCIFIALFILPVIFRDLRENKSILFGYWFVLSLHQIMAFTNAYVLRPRSDGRGFQTTSQELAMYEGWDFGIGGHFYQAMLAIVYRWLGSAHLLGEELSILMFALSCVVFLKIMQQLGMVRYKPSALIAFGALPSMVLFGSTTLRESYELFFFMLAVYFGIKMQKKGGVNAYMIALIISALIMGVNHNMLVFYAACLVMLFTFYTIRPAAYFWNIKKPQLMGIFIFPIILVGLVVLANINFPGTGLATHLVSLNILERAKNFRNNSIDQVASQVQKQDFGKSEHRGSIKPCYAGMSKTADACSPLGGLNYDVNINTSSFGTAVFSIIKIYGHYLFWPLPWQVSGTAGAYLAAVSVLRMILIYFSVWQWREAFGSQRKLLCLMLILYFSITFAWSIGTTNYGTAARHQVLSWWIIVIVGVPPLMEKMSRIRQKLLE